MTHTPGPWRVGDAGLTIFGPPNGKPAPQRIADLAPRDERRANAALIAAAPELYAALKEAAQSDELAWRHEPALLQRVLAVLAKVEGHNGR